MKKVFDWFFGSNVRKHSGAVAALVLTCLFLGKDAAQAQPPVLTISGDGVSARFSNYSLTNYGVVNGRNRGTFCFTLTNDSHPANPGQLPEYLIVAGIPEHMFAFSLISSSVQGSFTGIGQQMIPLEISSPTPDEISLSGFVATNVVNTLNPSHLPNGPNDGIPPGASASFCMVIDSAQPFTLNSIIPLFTVGFSSQVSACYVSTSLGPDLPASAKVVVTEFSQDSISFVIHNSPFGQPNAPALTGMGFDLPVPRSIVSRSLEPGRGFSVTQAPGRLRLPPGVFAGELDFALLSGPNIINGNPRFGMLPFSSRLITIEGDFAELTTGDILLGGLVRFENSWGPLFTPTLPGLGGCDGGPVGGAIRASVASNPR